MNKKTKKTVKKTVKTVKVAGAKRGRKPKLINFFFGKGRYFTVKDVFTRYAKSKTNKISKVAINVKLRNLVAAPLKERTMFVVGKVENAGRGRPFLKYILKNAMTPTQLRQFARA